MTPTDKTHVWNRIDYQDVVSHVPRTKLPACNRGSWYCPVATPSDAQTLDYLCRRHSISKIYDLGAGTLELAIDMDTRGYDVVAYEPIKPLTDFALQRHGGADIEVRNCDYYGDWDRINKERAAFVALGEVNCVPGDAPNGVTVDGMSVGV